MARRLRFPGVEVRGFRGLISDTDDIEYLDALVPGSRSLHEAGRLRVQSEFLVRDAALVLPHRLRRRRFRRGA